MQPNSPQIDIGAFNLARAIKAHETRGSRDPYNQRGASGEFGAYQWTKPTWQGAAQRFLGNANAPLTVENQNKVAYSTVKAWKDKGYRPDQIMSMWNAGEGRPNAHMEGFKGTNKFGASYDVPAYVASVSREYQRIKSESGGQSPDMSRQEQGLPEKEPTFLGSVARGILKLPATIASTVVPAARALAGEQDPYRPIYSKYLGDVYSPGGKAARALEQGTFIDPNKSFGANVGRAFGQAAKGTLGVAGVGAEAASYAVGGGALANVGKQTLGRFALREAGAGALGGFGIGAQQAASEAETFGQGVGQIAGGIALGGVAGLGFGALGAGASKVLNRSNFKAMTAAFSKDVPSDVLQRAQDDLTRSWGTFFESKKSLRTKLSREVTQGKDPAMELGQAGYIPRVNKGLLDASDIIDDTTTRIGERIDAVDQYVSAFDDRLVSLTQMEREAMQILRQSPDIGANLIKSNNELAQMFQSYRLKYGENVNPRILNAMRKEMNSKTKSFLKDKFVQDSEDAVADIARKYIDNLTGDDVVRRVNAEIAKIGSARKMARLVDGQAVEFGKMGQWFARTIGAMMGTSTGVPIIGTLLGAMGGEMLIKMFQRGAFSSIVQRRILQTLQKDKALLNEILSKVSEAERNYMMRQLTRVPLLTEGVTKSPTVNVPINLGG